MDSWTLNSRIKKILNDIIDVAYAGESTEARRRYKRFQLHILNTSLKSKHGDYRVDTATIRVFNPYRDGRIIAKTCLHELAHHIDVLRRGETDHQDPFYEEYAKLIYAALNMRILDLKDYADLNDRSSDSKKVRKILSAWTQAYVDYRLGDRSIVKVRNCYKQRDSLKERAYSWNSMESTWEKEIPSEDVEAELMALTALGLHDVESGPLDLTINPTIVISALGDTFPVREKLRENGFRYSKEEKKWTKKTTNNEAKTEVERLREIPELHLISFQYK